MYVLRISIHCDYLVFFFLLLGSDRRGARVCHMHYARPLLNVRRDNTCRLEREGSVQVAAIIFQCI